MSERRFYVSQNALKRSSDGKEWRHDTLNAAILEAERLTRGDGAARGVVEVVATVTREYPTVVTVIKPGVKRGRK